MNDLEVHREAPPVGEELHLPGPSILPFVCAISITLIVIGTTISWILTGLGGVLFVVTTIRWVRETRRDVDELPEEHRH